MKKLISAFLAAVIALTLAACASEQQNSDVPGNTQSEASTSTPAPDESDTAIFAATEGTWCLDGELGLINSFYFDSDTQFHMGNNDGNIYIKEGA